MTKLVTTVLGEERTAEVYPTGEWVCPWCQYAARPVDDTCPNPACDANPRVTPEELLARREKHLAEQKRIETERQSAASLAAFAEDHRHEQREWEQDQIYAAKQRGACVRCLFLSGHRRVQFVRHRGKCPKENQ